MIPTKKGHWEGEGVEGRARGGEKRERERERETDRQTKKEEVGPKR